MKKESVLQEAKRLTSKDRNKDYGSPLKDFTKQAAMWSVIIGHPVKPEHIPLCMVALKICRETNKHKRDNIVDGIGYFCTLDMLIAERDKQKNPAS